MINILTDKIYNHTDRNNLELRVGDYKSSGGTGHFILCKNGKLTTETMSSTGCFAAYTSEKFKITGDCVSIKFHGVAFSRTTISEVTPTTCGDLSYIDGCSNSIIIPPPRNGDPCINYLYFPPGIMQTQHTHPSLRLGLVLSGMGIAHTPNKKTELLPGMVFMLDRHTLHNFSTDVNSHMSLIVFHPDSDSGPTDEFNPMKTRTYIQR